MSRSQLPICTACGSQYNTEHGLEPAHCKICDDPRQFVPPAGQSWTTLNKIKEIHQNEWQQDSEDKNVWSIRTEPKFAIGQRAFLLQTASANVLWDMIALLDDPTVEFINSKGGLAAIVISHPHFYTTYVEWAQTFSCPVYVSTDDQGWLCQQPSTPHILNLIDGPAGTSQKIVPGVTAIKTGGHFAGSLVLHWKEQLFIADSIMTVPSAYRPHPRPPGLSSYAFQWSIPNMIPLPPSEMHKIWRAVRPYLFRTTHGAFAGTDVRGEDLRGRILESMKIQTRSEGWDDHAILKEIAPVS